ncbi:hypothetical protein [Hydrogenophaga sp.]|uniref:hypothetical protein n=1 Tax=Hydrogenophaga sp. TaxID=1904254 RepID=UPI0027307257|nr:hypothetical protein [Hydrogenophaga sp.]MDP2073344.1 hypothetical protein [Hydrogenophaga sp.]MDP3348872.1 hypothetical protein [Hydrogenophaga sp.]
MITDRFAELATQLDAGAAALRPDQIGRARADMTVRLGVAAQRELMHRRGGVAQDRVTAQARDQSRENAIREAMMAGKTREDAEGIVSSYLGPRIAAAIPDETSVQPTAQEEAHMQAAIDRLAYIGGLDEHAPAEIDNTPPPRPRVLVTPGRMPATEAETPWGQ